MDKQEVLERLTALQRQMTICGSISSLIVHDASTAAPKGSAQIRREMLGMVSRQLYDLNCGDETRALLDEAEKLGDGLDAAQRRMISKLRRTLEKTRAVPRELFLAFNKLKSDADMVWHEAKVNDDFAAFAPYIDRLVETMRAIAGHVAPGMDPYDYWLDNCQEGLSRAVCDPFFAQLKEALPPLIARTAAKPVDAACIRGDFPAAKQEEMTRWIMSLMQIDPRRASLCQTEHPYTASMTRDCVRVTTHYYPDNIARALFTILHEGGHALYNLHIPEEYAYNALGRLDCAAVHEGQSRFFENYVGRSRPFLGAILPRLKELFPGMKDVEADELYRAVNACAPGPIRMAADELTYPMHIIVRYELEKKLFAGEMTAADLPREWNRLYRELLGVEVPDNARGVLQDSHWSTGLYGYFPSYALGSAYGAQFLERMRETIDVDDCLRRADLTPLIDWLNEHVWRFGSLITPEEVLRNAFGGPFDPSCYVRYLTDKYTALYDL